MANTYSLIASNTVGATSVASVTFSSIPSTYTDLVIKLSTRGDRVSTNAEFFVKFNTSSANFTYKLLQGNGTTAAASSGGSQGLAGVSDAASNTASTFANSEMYIPNYASANYKSFSIDSVMENNTAGTTPPGYAYLIAGLWSNSAAISTIELYPESSTNWVQYSNFYLYGIIKS
jgi:hypothetical protein